MSYGETWQESCEKIRSLMGPLLEIVTEAEGPISSWDLFRPFEEQGHRTQNIQLAAFALMDKGLIELNPQFMIVLVPSREPSRFRSPRGH